MKNNLKSNIWKYYATGILQSFWFILAINILYYQSFGISYSQIGLFELVACLTIILLEIPTGAIADLISRKGSVFIGTLIIAIAMFTVGLGSSFKIFALSYFLWAVGGTFISGANTALIYDTMKGLKKEKNFLKIRGRYHFLTSLSLIAGVLIAPSLYNINRRLPYLLLGVAWLLSSIFILTMTEPYIKRKKYNLNSQIKQMKSGFIYSVTHHKIRWLILFTIILGAPMSLFNDMMTQPYFLSVGFKLSQLGIITALIWGSASLISAFAYKIERKIGEKLSLISIVVAQITALFFMSQLHVPFVLIFIILLYMFRDFRNVITENYLNLHIKSKIRATVLSVENMIFEFFMLFIYVLGGILTDMLGIHKVLSILTIFVALGALVLFVTRPEALRS